MAYANVHYNTAGMLGQHNNIQPCVNKGEFQNHIHMKTINQYISIVHKKEYIRLLYDLIRRTRMNNSLMITKMELL